MKAIVLLKMVLWVGTVTILSSCSDSGKETTEVDPEESAYRAEKAERDASKGRLAELRAEKKELEAAIKALKTASGKPGDLAKKELESTTELEAVRQYEAGLETLSKEVETSLGAWREATRASFKGVQLPEVTTIDGTKYSTVTINGVTDDTLVIEHSGGMQTIPIMQLPAGLRKNVIHEATVLAEADL